MWSHYQRTIEGIEMNKTTEALELAEALENDAKEHREVSYGLDCPPERTANWKHALNCEAAARLIREALAEPDMKDAIIAGNEVLLNEQAQLLRECRSALDSLIKQRPNMAGLLCGSTTLGNLRAGLGAYRPSGVMNGTK